MVLAQNAKEPDTRMDGILPVPGVGGTRWRLWALLAGLGLLAATGLLGLDRRVEQIVHDHLPGWLHGVADTISLLGMSGCYAIAAALLLGWSWRIRPNRLVWRACLWLLTAEAVLAVAVRVLKIVFGRWRPDRELAGQFEFLDLRSKCHSFPSGHTADAAVVATVIWFMFPRLRPLCVAWVVLMGASRVCALQHFVGDVAAGAVLGILCALAVGRKLDAMERWIAPAPFADRSPGAG
ncbi:MAG: phosphatase PAP2 family protein [Kiritimatiellia bacterium]